MPDWKHEIKTRLAGLQLTPAREAEIKAVYNGLHPLSPIHRVSPQGD
jgi:hypothetical protein